MKTKTSKIKAQREAVTREGHLLCGLFIQQLGMLRKNETTNMAQIFASPHSGLSGKKTQTDCLRCAKRPE